MASGSPDSGYDFFEAENSLDHAGDQSVLPAGDSSNPAPPAHQRSVNPSPERQQKTSFARSDQAEKASSSSLTSVSSLSDNQHERERSPSGSGLKSVVIARHSENNVLSSDHKPKSLLELEAPSLVSAKCICCVSAVPVPVVAKWLMCSRVVPDTTALKEVISPRPSPQTLRRWPETVPKSPPNQIRSLVCTGTNTHRIRPTESVSEPRANRCAVKPGVRREASEPSLQTKCMPTMCAKSPPKPPKVSKTDQDMADFRLYVPVTGAEHKQHKHGHRCRSMSRSRHSIKEVCISYTVNPRQGRTVALSPCCQKINGSSTSSKSVICSTCCRKKCRSRKGSRSGTCSPCCQQKDDSPTRSKSACSPRCRQKDGSPTPSMSTCSPRCRKKSGSPKGSRCLTCSKCFRKKDGSPRRKKGSVCSPCCQTKQSKCSKGSTCCQKTQRSPSANEDESGTESKRSASCSPRCEGKKRSNSKAKSSPCSKKQKKDDADLAGQTHRRSGRRRSCAALCALLSCGTHRRRDSDASTSGRGRSRSKQRTGSRRRSSSTSTRRLSCQRPVCSDTLVKCTRPRQSRPGRVDVAVQASKSEIAISTTALSNLGDSTVITSSLPRTSTPVLVDRQAESLDAEPIEKEVLRGTNEPFTPVESETVEPEQVKASGEKEEQQPIVCNMSPEGKSSKSDPTPAQRDPQPKNTSSPHAQRPQSPDGPSKKHHEKPIATVAVRVTTSPHRSPSPSPHKKTSPASDKRWARTTTAPNRNIAPTHYTGHQSLDPSASSNSSTQSESPYGDSLPHQTVLLALQDPQQPFPLTEEELYGRRWPCCPWKNGRKHRNPSPRRRTTKSSLAQNTTNFESAFWSTGDSSLYKLKRSSSCDTTVMESLAFPSLSKLVRPISPLNSSLKDRLEPGMVPSLSPSNVSLTLSFDYHDDQKSSLGSLGNQVQDSTHGRMTELSKANMSEMKNAAQHAGEAEAEAGGSGGERSMVTETKCEVEADRPFNPTEQLSEQCTSPDTQPEAAPDITSARASELKTDTNTLTSPCASSVTEPATESSGVGYGTVTDENGSKARPLDPNMFGTETDHESKSCSVADLFTSDSPSHATDSGSTVIRDTDGPEAETVNPTEPAQNGSSDKTVAKSEILVPEPNTSIPNTSAGLKGSKSRKTQTLPRYGVKKRSTPYTLSSRSRSLAKPRKTVNGVDKTSISRPLPSTQPATFTTATISKPALVTTTTPKPASATTSVPRPTFTTSVSFRPARYPPPTTACTKQATSKVSKPVAGRKPGGDRAAKRDKATGRPESKARGLSKDTSTPQIKVHIDLQNKPDRGEHEAGPSSPRKSTF